MFLEVSPAQHFWNTSDAPWSVPSVLLSSVPSGIPIAVGGLLTIRMSFGLPNVLAKKTSAILLHTGTLGFQDMGVTMC